MVTWLGVSAIRERNAAVGDARWFQATALVGPSQQPTHQSLATGQPVSLVAWQHWAVGGGRQRCPRLWLCVTARQPLPKSPSSVVRRTIQAVLASQHPSNHLVLDDEARFTDVMLQIRPRSARQRSQTDQTRKAHHHHQAMMAMHMFATEPAQETRQHQTDARPLVYRASPKTVSRRAPNPPTSDHFSHHQISSTLISANCLPLGQKMHAIPENGRD